MATAYSSTVDQTDGDPFTTASGTHVHPGTLATNFLPFGTKVRIGSTIYTVEDRMNSRYNGRYIVDLWFSTRAEARQFGVRVVEMEIVALPQ
jgi:3D (Asp-Asp-Asp) domain-containing protein